MLKLFRKIFGCYSEPEIASIILPIPEDHISTVETVTEADETKTLIADIVSGVIQAKESEHISYVEDAMDDVTDGKFKFIKYRPVIIKPKTTKISKVTA